MARPKITDLDESLKSTIDGKAEQSALDTTNGNISDLQINKADQTSLDTTNNNLSTHTSNSEIHVNITSGTANPSGGSDGDVYLQYE